MASVERNCCVAAPIHQLFTHLIHGLLGGVKTKERLTPERVRLFGRGLQLGMEPPVLYSRMEVWRRDTARCAVSASLRNTFADFLASAKFPTDCRYNTSTDRLQRQTGQMRDKMV